MRAQSVDSQAPALWLHRGSPPAMTRAHRHDDVEFNLVLSGTLRYTFWGEPLTIEGGELAVFWGAVPHLLHSTDPVEGEVGGSRGGLRGGATGDGDGGAGDTEGIWVHVPLATVLGWGLPTEHLARLLRPAPVVVPVRGVSRGAATMMSGWLADVADGVDLTIVMLEAQSLLRRVLGYESRVAGASGAGSSGFEASGAGSSGASGAGSSGAAASATGSAPDGEASTGPARSDASHPVHASTMARYITENFRDAVRTSDVAATVHLSPGHASAVFKASLGVSIGTFLQRCRVAEAQRLLISTTDDVTDVAHGVGYTSMSSFYEQFTRICGASPAAYRRQLRGE